MSEMLAPSRSWYAEAPSFSRSMSALMLMLADYGFTADDVLLFVVSGKGEASGTVEAFLSTRLGRRSNNLLKTMSSVCNGGAFEWNNYKSQCFSIDSKKVDKKENRTQQLGRIVLADVPFELKALDFTVPGREGEKPSVALELRPGK